jgi:hypothetical protein
MNWSYRSTVDHKISDTAQYVHIEKSFQLSSGGLIPHLPVQKSHAPSRRRPMTQAKSRLCPALPWMIVDRAKRSDFDGTSPVKFACLPFHGVACPGGW